jgi:hypothetical protein
MPSIAIALVAVLVIGGVSAAAQTSLPGQPLYPIKVHINENLEGAFALSDSMRADWDMGIISERLSEAQQLASQGQLSAAAQTDITNNFDTHLYDIGSMITKLKVAGNTTDAAKISAKFKAMLTGQQELLASSSTQLSSATQQALVPVVAELQGALSAAAVLSSSTTTSVDASVKK